MERREKERCEVWLQQERKKSFLKTGRGNIRGVKKVGGKEKEKEKEEEEEVEEEKEEEEDK